MHNIRGGGGGGGSNKKKKEEEEEEDTTQQYDSTRTTTAPPSQPKEDEEAPHKLFLGKHKMTGTTHTTMQNNGTIVDDPKSKSTTREWKRVHVAVGSNLGDRYGNIQTALCLLQQQSHEVRVVQTSFLRETAPMYVTNQPAFLNGVVELETLLEPWELLHLLKTVEHKVGRPLPTTTNDNNNNSTTVRNGPRCVDLDILLYPDKVVVQHQDLQIPHARIAERDFVLRPLCDLNPHLKHPVLQQTMHQLLQQLEPLPEPATRVIPLKRQRFLTLRPNVTLVMGILNVTPDSFSDGGRNGGCAERAVQEALQMEQNGADMVDVGGESTRPGAKPISAEEQIRRTIPVIAQLRQVSDMIISIDTRNATVARAAIQAGADIVNDVSGGTFDDEMLRTVADLHVPLIIMHTRGTPETMQQYTDSYSPDGLVASVARELQALSQRAQEAGVWRWMQILDPGIGFAKDGAGNLNLLRASSQQLVGNFPILWGPSRKGFLGKITGETEPAHRDFATAAACLIASLHTKDGECGAIVRVHNVKGIKQAIMVLDAVRNNEEHGD